MSARPGILVDVRRPADGGVSPNRYVAVISAEIRCHWPPRATAAEVEGVLAEAYLQAVMAAREERVAR